MLRIRVEIDRIRIRLSRKPVPNQTLQKRIWIPLYVLKILSDKSLEYNSNNFTYFYCFLISSIRLKTGCMYGSNVIQIRALLKPDSDPTKICGTTAMAAMSV